MLDIHMQRSAVGSLLHITYKITSKWILNVRVKLRFLDENIRVNFCEPGLNNGILDMTQKHKLENKHL